MVNKLNLLRHAELLLVLSASSSDPEVSASLAQRAGDLKAKADSLEKDGQEKEANIRPHGTEDSRKGGELVRVEDLDITELAKA